MNCDQALAMPIPDSLLLVPWGGGGLDAEDAMGIGSVKGSR
jgi:hypothetical protein